MRLKVILPTKILKDMEVTKVVAESEDGYFGILPKHIDFVAALVPGILSFQSENGEEFLAVDEGILVKCGSWVMVSTRRATASKDLNNLKRTVSEEFLALDEDEKRARSILSKLEADFARHFMKIMDHG